MIASLIIFGLLSGTLFAILVGIFGATRRIGFGWAFILSLILTPFGGLLCALISDPLPTGERRWGCIAYLILLGALATLALFIFTLLGAVMV